MGDRFVQRVMFQSGREDKGRNNNQDKIRGFFAPLRMTIFFLSP
jgi:hypothetical protein